MNDAVLLIKKVDLINMIHRIDVIRRTDMRRMQHAVHLGGSELINTGRKKGKNENRQNGDYEKKNCDQLLGQGKLPQP